MRVYNAPEGAGDDFFVLPGESLAKYTRPEDEEEERSPTEAAMRAEPENSGSRKKARP